MFTGIDCTVKDARGRTASEVLREHTNDNSGELTQVMQHREVWLECATLIDGIVQSFVSYKLTVIYFRTLSSQHHR
jgi:hypothetical protein